MNDDVQARAYAEADFNEPHSMFVELLRERFPTVDGAVHVLDLGCGAADITIRVARAFPDATVDAVDGAEAMLHYAQHAITAAGVQRRVQLVHGCLPDALPDPGAYDLIISNSLLHHLRDPLDLWRSIKRHARTGTAVFVMDLLRPANRAAVAALVDHYAADEPDILRRDFFNSLCAAYRSDEVRRQLAETALDFLSVEQVSDRHLVVSGAM